MTNLFDFFVLWKVLFALHYQELLSLRILYNCNRKTIVDAVGQNENVLFYWSLVSQDIDEEEWSSELLLETINFCG